MSRSVSAVATPPEVVSAALPAGEDAAGVGVRGRRIYFVDLLRLVASFQMVHGHTLDALMADELRAGVIFDRWSWGRGLVSVAFMVAAGLSFHLSTIARFEQHKRDPAKVRRRFRRGAWLVVLGYLLHFPADLFSADPSTVAASLNAFQIADVLQCIGLCILILQTLVMICRRPKQVVWAAAGLMVLAFALAPIGDRVTPDGPLRFLLNYVSHRGGSLFPLTPWAGFVMAGVVVGELVLPQGTRTPVTRPIPRLVAISAAVLGVASLCELVPYTLVLDGTSTNASPAFNLTKLAATLAILSVLAVGGSFVTRLPRVLQILAGESLMLYVFHLLLLYGSGFGLYHVVGRTLPLGTALLVALFLILLTATVGLGWYHLKRWRAARRALAAP